MKGINGYRRPREVGYWGVVVSSFLSVLFLLTSCGSDMELYKDPFRSDNLHISDGPIFDFGDVEQGQFVAHVFMVSNLGSVTLSEMVSDFYLSMNFSYAGGSFPGEGGTCKSELEPGAQCTFKVSFHPKYVGAFEGLVTISYFNGEATKTAPQIILKGRGLGKVENH